jgi:hypothetical protein
MATQHGKDYWLYVIDGCSDGQGRVFGTFQDPVKIFESDITADAVFRVPGSSLARAASSGSDQT